MKFNKSNALFFTSLLVIVANSCLAVVHHSHHGRGSSSGSPILFIFVFLLFAAFPIYFLFILPLIKRIKAQKYCQKNNLKFTAKSKVLPDNMNFKFIQLKTESKAECIYKNLMQGQRYGISFLMCEFYLKYSDGHGTVETSVFPLLIIKKSDAYFPTFLLGGDLNLDDFGRITYYSGINNRRSSLESDFHKSISFFEGKNLYIDEDKDFSDKFFLKVEDEYNAKSFFNEKIRNVFNKKANFSYIYEGNGDYFIISTPSYLSSFDGIIKFFEENIKFYYELTSI